MKKRMEEAKKLLSSTDLPVKEIVRQVGYLDANYFSQLFKKLTGLSPLQYRQLNR